MDRIPLWFKCGLPDARSLKRVMGVVSSLGLNTICFEARCPNKGECCRKGSVTFLILGKHCTRKCRFCNVTAAEPETVDPGEPQRLADACRDLELDYVSCYDPDGALGIALLFYCPDVETTTKVVSALQAEGARASYLHHVDIPDWHMGFHWKPVFVAEPPNYKSYDYASRAVHIDIMPQDTEEHCMMQAEAIRKVALAYLK